MLRFSVSLACVFAGLLRETQYSLIGSEHTKVMEDMNFTRFQTIQRWFKLIGITLAVYLVMEYALPKVFPFCVGFILAAFLVPIRRFLQKRCHFHKSLACFAAFFLGIGLLAVVLSLFCLFVCYLGRNLCGGSVLLFCQNQGNTMWGKCCEALHDLTGTWVFRPKDFTRFFFNIRDNLLSLDSNQALSSWKMLGGQTLKLLATMMVILVSALIIVGDYENLITFARERLKLKGIGTKIKRVAGSYIKAQLLIILTITSICVAGLFLIGQKHAVVIGILIGICDALPFLGTGICLLPWALFQVLGKKMFSAVGLILIYILCTFTRQILEPKLIGERFGVHPLAILMSIYIGIKVYSKGGFLLGPISAFLIWQLMKAKVPHGSQEDAEDDNGAAI